MMLELKWAQEYDYIRRLKTSTNNRLFRPRYINELILIVVIRFGDCLNKLDPFR